MAYLIFDNLNGLVKIAANDSDKDNLNLDLSLYSVVSVSDEDFTKVKNNVVEPTYDGTSVSYSEDEIYSIDQQNLEMIIDDYKKVIKAFLDVPSNEEKSNYSAIKSYYDYLNELDFSSLSYPIESSWESYCQDNSISYFNPLQIP